ncbi:MAG: methionyl-tRNA formyltransferase [Patescibacteria group bacterium]|nr:methionyl-tRNA formyltransferase [Patescibacteria group bacterium]MCL5261752.1 methionyl-tRNA formyltransferase [Patescibacteria group bacterium]
MKFIFFGTPEFAAIILNNLIKFGFAPEAVVTNPDKPAGRKHIVAPSAVKRVVVDSKEDIKVFQPEKITPKFLDVLRSTPADFYLVAAYAKILPQELIDIPESGVIGVHPSLLPELRGASPIQGALLEGKSVSGVSLFLIDSQMDHGPVLSQERMSVDPDDNTETLTRKLAELSSRMLIKTLPEFIAGKIKATEQDESKATFTGKFETKSAFIDAKDLKAAESGDIDLAKIVHNKIRAFYPEPGVWTTINSKRVKLLASKIGENGKLKLETVQIEGQKPKPAGDFEI